MQTKNGAEYTVILCDTVGNELLDVSDFRSLSIARAVNNVGALRLSLTPSPEVMRRLTIPDGWVKVYRTRNGQTRLVMDTVYFMQDVDMRRDDRGTVTLDIGAVDPNWLLEEPGRFIAYPSGTTQALKTLPADDMIKEIVREALSTSAPAASQITLVPLYIAANGSQAPSFTKAFAWRPVLQTLQEIAAVSTILGTYLAFDMTAVGDALLFATYVGARGIDRRATSPSPLILSPENGTLGAVRLLRSYRNEVTSVIAGGKGEGLGRLLGTYTDTLRSVRTPFRYRHAFVNATQYDAVTGLEQEAEAAVRQGRPRVIFEATALDTAGARYSEDWDFGDYVTAEAFGFRFDCRLDVVTIEVGEGVERVTAQLRADQDGGLL